MNTLLLSKLTSGRFWLSVIAGIVFAATAIGGTLPTEATVMLLVMIFRDYFARNREGEVLK